MRAGVGLVGLLVNRYILTGCNPNVIALYNFALLQRVGCKEVEEETFYSLVQHFAIVLFECGEVDDYTPAKTLMNMSFTYFHWTTDCKKQRIKQYVYECLREQPIWRSLRFWTAAFFDAVQSEREKSFSNKPRKRLEMQSEEDVAEEANFNENITFGQLGLVFVNEKELCFSLTYFQNVHLQYERIWPKQKVLHRIP